MDETKVDVSSLEPNEYRIQVHGRTLLVRFNGPGSVTVDGIPCELTVREGRDGIFHMVIGDSNFRFWPGGQTLDPREFDLFVDGHAIRGVIDDRRSILRQKTKTESGGVKGSIDVKAPMPGLVTKILVTPGMHVERGQGMVVLEAMKMENELRAESDGIVQEIGVKERMPVEKGQLLLKLTHLQVKPHQV